MMIYMFTDAYSPWHDYLSLYVGIFWIRINYWIEFISQLYMKGHGSTNNSVVRWSLRNKECFHTQKSCFHKPDRCSWWRHQMETFSALLALCAGIHRWPVNSPHKDQWRGALMFSLVFTWINGWVNNRQAGDLRRHRAQYDVIVMEIGIFQDMPWLLMPWLLTLPGYDERPR